MLLVGFLVVATAGVLALLRGRRPAVTALLGGVLVVVLAWATLGRGAVGDLALGALLGVPVLAAGIRSHDRRAAARPRQHGHQASASRKR